MSEAAEPQNLKGQRIFISYSRADRQRVAGLASLLEALEHHVFVDQRSIRPGKRWQEMLEQELGAADVLLVFWTRHAARSDWVRREYESFETRFPDRPLVPVIGDTTPLAKALQARQLSDFCPLINELLATVRDLEEKGVGKREIRAVVLKRLEEEGIKLPKDKRNRLFGLLGVVGVAAAPLQFLQFGRDLLADKVSTLPSAYYYTAVGAGAAGFLACHALPGDQVGRADFIPAPDLFPVPIRVGQTGTAACEAEGMICVSVSRTSILDVEQKFFGYSTPPCSARVTREFSCRADFNTDFAMTGVVLRRSPDADEGVQDLSGFSHFCLGYDQGRQGIYPSANCVKP